MTTTTPLKPCPFCGGDPSPEANEYRCVELRCDCGARSAAHFSLEEAAKSWNTRPLDDDRIAAARDVLSILRDADEELTAGLTEKCMELRKNYIASLAKRLGVE